MQIALNTYSLRKEFASGALSFENEAFFDLLSKTEVKGLEIWANHMESQGWDESESKFHEFQDSLKDHDIKIVALCVENGITSSPRPEYISDKEWFDSVSEVNMERYCYGEMYSDIAIEFDGCHPLGHAALGSISSCKVFVGLLAQFVGLLDGENAFFNELVEEGVGGFADESAEGGQIDEIAGRVLGVEVQGAVPPDCV